MNPLTRLADDRTAAHERADPWASLCVLATTAHDNTPQARVLVLRDLEDGLGVFVNTTSPKHHEIAHNATAAVLVYLASIGVQYRLQARLTPLAPELVHTSWTLRPEIPKVMDWLYQTRVPQSTELESRDALLKLFDDVRDELPANATAPDSAAGYKLEPVRIERLQLAGDRVHERDLYRLEPDGWCHRVLVP